LPTDPAILIIDEATSSVDVITEEKIQNALARLIKGRTSFIIAHRLGSAKHADLILVMDHGRIIESGTHHSLLNSRGTYAKLYARFKQFESL
jgi:ATP-binding cassette subfamily B protein